MGFYRRFIKGYATIPAPLNKLLMKDKFVWSKEAQVAFTNLKGVIMTTPVLSVPNFELPFVLEIDASGVSMGAVLSQQGHPITFF